MPIGRYGAALGLSIVRIDAFEVGEHDIEIQVVLVLCSRVLDDCRRDCILVIAAELETASRALLLKSHGANLPSAETASRSTKEPVRQV